MEDKHQITWINGAKLVAIIAVLIDHTQRVLYQNLDIAEATYFSVSLFIILSGMTSYLSDLRHDKLSGGGQNYIHKVTPLLTAYCVATAIYMIATTYEFDLAIYVSNLIHFSATSPFYFIMVYLQLMLVNRFLFNFLQKCPNSIKGYLYEFLMMIGIIVFSGWTSNYTNILDLYGGGGKLLGGTYLIMYYLGMIFIKHGWLEKVKIVKSLFALIVPGIVWFMLWKCVCTYGMLLDNYIPLSVSKNPPGITCMLCGGCVLFIVYGFFTLLEQIRGLKKVVQLLSEGGKHSMYIYLYHYLVYENYLMRYMGNLPAQNIWAARIVFLLTMFFVPILIEIFIKYIRQFFVGILRPNGQCGV